MIKRSALPATFTIDRHYPAKPARVFAAWATVEAKARWAYCDEAWKPQLHELDFRVGGRERAITGPAGGTRHIFEAIYWDIVPGERIVFSYDMHLDARRISVSLSTIEFFAEAGGTRMRFTEQGVFLDGYDDVAGREEGTRIGLDNLERVLREGLDRGELDQTETDRRRAAS
ncbi:MAG: SRPBCC family protein [Reyranella sp.]|jgi:uncharacterized protein YndB with AHSA1/START domain|uniref:SRPBCC family protein n=1 Tax=Reyranella sp. TaxID=1929291 RepID=UPI0025FFDAD1|nr:SRPBCC family protein [Reyranella sp.]MBR2813340.1 SRPBCC family protein [Reyranella sp.]